MTARTEYLLFTESLGHASGQLVWRFLLLQAGSDHTVTASDLVDEDSMARAELLAVVRGLEAIDGAASVRLFTGSDYIHRGLVRDLPHWRAQRWHWERFGRRVPIRDADLWQRVAGALNFHQVESRLWGDQAAAHADLACQSEPTSDVYHSPEPNIRPHIVDESAVLVVPKRKRVRRRDRVAAAARNQIGGLRRSVGSALMPAG